MGSAEEELEEGKQLASVLGTLGYCMPNLTGSRAHQSASPVSLGFAQKQAVGIVFESSALCDGSPLDSNRGRCEEEGRSREERSRERERESGRERGRGEKRWLHEAGPQERQERGS